MLICLKRGFTSCLFQYLHMKSIRSLTFYSKISYLCSTFNFPYKENQLIVDTKRKWGLFNYEQLINYNGFHLMKKDVFSCTEKLIEEALSDNKNRHIVMIFDELSNALCCVADMADFVRVMHPDKNWISAADETCIAIGLLVEQLNTNVKLYNEIKNELSENTKTNVKMNETDYLVGNLFLKDFEQSGIHLSEDVRSEFVNLSEQIFKLGYTFSKACFMPSYVPKDRFPAHLIKYFQEVDNKVCVSNLMTDVHDKQIREVSYKQYFSVNESQEKTLEGLLTARKNIAKLIGFKSYSEKALRGSMASPSIVDDFLNELSKRIKNKADNDLEILNSFNDKPGHLNINAWDVAYLIKQHRSNIWRKYKISEKLLCEYFTLGSCMQGLDEIFKNLYDVRLEVCEVKNGETWHEDVKKISVVDQSTQNTIGIIYCDFFERPNKPNQDCHFTIRGGKLKDNGEYQIPVVVLALNFAHQTDATKPVLLSYSNIENLFHEFGHAMHSMLGATRYQHVTGTRCTTDFAEVPSILMEYFVCDERIINIFAQHWKTKEPLPAEIIQHLISSKKKFQALELQQQVIYSIMDQKFHSEEYTTGCTMDMMKDIHDGHSSVPYTPGTAYHLRFSHFVGYGAKYYSYIWSRALAGLVWNELFVGDPLARGSGARWKDEVLKHGGEKEPRLMIEEILGRTIDTGILVESLSTEFI